MPLLHPSRIVVPALLALVLAVVGCGDDASSGGSATQTAPALPQADGLVVRPVDGTVRDVVAAIERQVAQGPATIVEKIDHAAAAKRAGLQLPPTTLLVLGNPKVGTQLLRRAQTAGIDLPQKLLVFERDGEVFVAYNESRYLSARHGIDGADNALETAESALAGLAEGAGAREPADDEAGEESIAPRPSANDVPGLVVIESDNSVKVTIDALVDAVKDGPAGVVFDVDHRRNAASVDLRLDPTRVVAIGNPMAGTPLMRAARTIAIDLPQKFLAWKDAEGQVRLAYNDPEYLAERHGLEGADRRLRTIAVTLSDLASAATKR